MVYTVKWRRRNQPQKEDSSGRVNKNHRLEIKRSSSDLHVPVLLASVRSRQIHSRRFTPPHMGRPMPQICAVKDCDAISVSGNEGVFFDLHDILFHTSKRSKTYSTQVGTCDPEGLRIL